MDVQVRNTLRTGTTEARLHGFSEKQRSVMVGDRSLQAAYSGHTYLSMEHFEGRHGIEGSCLKANSRAFDLVKAPGFY